MSTKADPITIDPKSGLTILMETCADDKSIAITLTFPEYSELAPSADDRNTIIQIIRTRLQDYDVTIKFDDVEDKTYLIYNGRTAYMANFMLKEASAAMDAIAARTRDGIPLNNALDEALSYEQAKIPEQERLINPSAIAQAIGTALPRDIIPRRDAILLADTLSKRLAKDYPVWPKIEEWTRLKTMYGAIKEPLSAFITDEDKLKAIMVKVMSAVEHSYDRAGAVGRG